jgi:uncharacterized phage protein (TIGR01671 family)
MNDRFKFRVFDYNSKIMIYSSELKYPFTLAVHDFHEAYMDDNTYSFPMFCTGLKDKNSKLIYQNDILSVNNGFVSDKIFVVGRPQISDCHTVWGLTFFGINMPAPEHCEVIGNVLENPELLEKC